MSVASRNAESKWNWSSHVNRYTENRSRRHVKCTTRVAGMAVTERRQKERSMIKLVPGSPRQNKMEKSIPKW